MVTDAPFASVGTNHKPVWALKVPTLGVALTNVVPAGILSLTLIFVASLGPSFVRVKV